MRQANFVERHRKEWDEMREFLASSKRTADSRPFAGADFPARYRRLCQQLSVAESRGYSRGLQQELHDLVLRAHQQLYAERVAPWRAIARFLLLEYPQLVRSQWRYLAVAFALFMAPILILIATIQYHPDFVHTILDPDEIATMEFMYNPELKIGSADNAKRTPTLGCLRFIYVTTRPSAFEHSSAASCSESEPCSFCCLTVLPLGQ